MNFSKKKTYTINDPKEDLYGLKLKYTGQRPIDGYFEFIIVDSDEFDEYTTGDGKEIVEYGE